MTTDAVFAQSMAADSAALAAAAGSAEEALACHREALVALASGWRSETGSAATDSLQRQCAEATDIVAQLHRAAAALSVMHADWTDPVGDVIASAGGDGMRPIAASGAEAGGPPDVPSVVDVPSAAPAAAPGPSAPPAADSGAAPSGPSPSWVVPPVAAPQAPPTWQGGGPSALDLGGALAGLVAQIAQALGSYADAPPDPPAAAPPGKPPRPKAETPPPHHGKPKVATRASPAGLPKIAVPKSAAPQPPIAAPLPAPEQLLAAERPPDPAPPPEQAPEPPPVTAPVPEPVPPPVAPAPTQAAEPRTPCEIAADELPKVGE